MTVTLPIIFYTLIICSAAIIFLTIAPYIYKGLAILFKTTRYSSMGESSQIRLVRQLDEAVGELAAEKTGAIITIVNKNNLDNFRTDGIKIDASISSSLLIAIFNKHSPLHDGAIIIDNNTITYASTFYKITNRSIDNKYGARHRAALWISEQTDSLTIVVSEETGKITFAKGGKFIIVDASEFQEKLTEFIS